MAKHAKDPRQQRANGYWEEVTDVLEERDDADAEAKAEEPAAATTE